jgi:hypothetical protein
LILARAVLRSFKSLVAAAAVNFDPYRLKVAEEMLLCEVIVQYNIYKHHDKQSAYEGAVQQDCEKSLSRQLPTDCFYYQAFISVC